MSCEGKDLKTFSDEDLLAARAGHETGALFAWGDGTDKMAKENALIGKIWTEVARRMEADPAMIQLRKSLEEEDFDF